MYGCLISVHSVSYNEKIIIMMQCNVVHCSISLSTCPQHRGQRSAAGQSLFQFVCLFEDVSVHTLVSQREERDSSLLGLNLSQGQ